MRGILFKGKRVDNGEWTYGFYFEHSIDGQKQSYIKYQTFDEGFVTNEVDVNTVGQYTGIKDDSHLVFCWCKGHRTAIYRYRSGTICDSTTGCI